MHTPDPADNLPPGHEVDEALAAYEGFLDAPNPAHDLRVYYQELRKYPGVPPVHTAPEGMNPIHLRLTIPAWRHAREHGEGRVGLVLGERRFIAHDGVDIDHDIVEHSETRERLMRFSLYLGKGKPHYHAVAPMAYELKETPRGPVLRLTTEVVECKPPKAVLAAALSALLEALGDELDPEDFQ